MKFTLRLFISLFILFVWSCDSNRLDVDISDMDIELEIKRFEVDLFAPTDDINGHIKSLKSDYGELYNNYTQLIPTLGHPNDPAHAMYLNQLRNDPDLQQINRDVIATYPDLESLTAELETAFKYLKYHLPGIEVPRVYTMNSALNASPLVNDAQMAIALDLFLGRDYGYYEAVRYPKYLSKRMSPEYIVYNSMRGWVTAEFEKSKDDKSFVNDLIHEGKLLYLMDAMFPNGHDSLKIEYSGAELAWCKQFEINVWGLFLDKELLYSTDKSETDPFLTEGPFTPGLAKESPARVGTWIGWRIVRSYMKNNDVSIEAMMEAKPQDILNQSGYRPK